MWQHRHSGFKEEFSRSALKRRPALKPDLLPVWLGYAARTEPLVCRPQPAQSSAAILGRKVTPPDFRQVRPRPLTLSGMSEDTSIDDLVLLDLHYSGLLRGELAQEVQRRLENDPALQTAAEQYLTDWTALLDVLKPEGLVPDGAEDRLIARLPLINDT